MREIEGSVEAPRDFELNRDRDRPVGYIATLPDESPARGLVFAIPGFGSDASDDYAKGLRAHLAEAHGLVAVSVDYHCRRARPNLGATLDIDMRARLTLLGLCAAAGAGDVDLNDLPGLCARAGRIQPGFQIEGLITPPDGEEQNFGILQAMDHLAVLGALRARDVDFDHRRVIAFGSSHGGYIAHLMAKLAPRTFAAIIDNSSYVQAPYCYLGVGVGYEFVGHVDQLHVLSRVKSPWSLANRGHAGFFDRNRELVRDVGHPPHIAAMTEHGAGGPSYFMCNSAEDSTSPPAVKRRQRAALAAAGLRAELDIVTADRIDGTIFKSASHGLDASLRGLFDRYGPRVEPREVAHELDGAPVRYDCVDVAYAFTHADKPPYIAGRVIALFDELEELDASAARRPAA